MRASFALVLCGSVVLAANGADDTVNAELKMLEGTWVHVSTEQFGKLRPEPRTLWIFQGDRANVHFSNRPANTNRNSWTFSPTRANLTLTHRFRLDPTQSPKAIDEQTEYPNAKDLIAPILPAIYKIEGDTLTICFAGYQDMGKRPADFTVPEGSDRRIYVLKREK